jgi:hypothetical protein
MACVLATSSPAQTPDFTCGDSDGNGQFNIGDIVYTLTYLIKGGPPPVDFSRADADDHFNLNAADLDLMGCSINCDPGFRYCPPTSPVITTTIAPDILLRHPNVIPQGLTSARVSLDLQIPDSAKNYSAAAFSLVAQILVDGAPATIDSIIYPLPGTIFDEWVSSSSLRPDSAQIILGYWSIRMGYDNGTLAQIDISFPTSPSERSVAVNLAVTSPAQSPTADSSLYTMFLRASPYGWIEPTVVGHCCLVPGDANFDGATNIADVTFGIARTFSGGGPPRCADAADANGDNSFNIADVTYLLARIFSGGPAPICGTTGI